MTDAEMKRILIYCQVLGIEGLNNGMSAHIPELEINILPPNTFLGSHSNPAIFVSEVTYKKLKQFHEDWIPNVTIAVSSSYLLEPKRSCIDIIGVLIHESGHAFNVYAKIPNTEANAYVFEIETMLKLFKMNVLKRQFGLTKEDVGSYFKSRMDQYQLELPKNADLKKLVDNITDFFELANDKAALERLVKIQIKLSFFKKEGNQERPEERRQARNNTCAA